MTVNPQSNTKRTDISPAPAASDAATIAAALAPLGNNLSLFSRILLVRREGRISVVAEVRA